VDQDVEELADLGLELVGGFLAHAIYLRMIMRCAPPSRARGPAGEAVIGNGMDREGISRVTRV
jgi:hypothetical protein